MPMHSIALRAKESISKSSSNLTWLSEKTVSMTDPSKIRRPPVKPEQVYGHFCGHSLSPISSMFSCVDFRGKRPIIATPGGDFGEFLLAYNCYSDIIGVDKDTQSYDSVKGMMAEFINRNCSTDRPFYKHTDAGRIGRLNAKMGVPSFPIAMPKDLDGWKQALVDPEMHGCGHLRSILTDSPKYLLNSKLAHQVVWAFYELYWSPEYSQRLLLEILPCPTTTNVEAGLVIQDHSVPGKPDECQAFTPYVQDEGFFTVNIRSQQVYREKLIAPFFEEHLKKHGVSFSVTDFVAKLNGRAFVYWKNTGAYLDLIHIPLTEIKDDGYIIAQYQ